MCESVCVKKAINIIRAGKYFVASVTEDCNLCGLCAEFCFSGALRPFLNGEQSSQFGELYQLERLSFEAELCTFCGQCEEKCSKNAIVVRRDLDFSRAFDGRIEIEKELCNGCGLCRDVCGYSAIEITGKAVTNDDCLYCGLCADICPQNAIRVVRRKTGDPVVSTGFGFQKYMCSLCGECERTCPTGAIRIQRPLSGYIDFYNEKCIEKCTVCMEVCRNSAVEIEYRGEKMVIFMEDRCNLCGTCEKFCPGNAIEIQRDISEELELEGLMRAIRDGRKSTGREIEIKDSCSGCGVCVEVCPVSGNHSTVLEIYRGTTKPVMRERCSTCGLCMHHCPEGAIHVEEITE